MGMIVQHFAETNKAVHTELLANELEKSFYWKIWSFHITAGDFFFNSYDKGSSHTWNVSFLTEKSCLTKVSLLISDLAVHCQPLSSRLDRWGLMPCGYRLRETISVYSWRCSMGPDSQPKTLRKNNLDMTSESEIKRELVIKNDSILNWQIRWREFQIQESRNSSIDKNSDMLNILVWVCRVCLCPVDWRINRARGWSSKSRSASSPFSLY